MKLFGWLILFTLIWETIIFVDSVRKKNLNNDVLFFLLSNYILSGAILAFFYTFKDGFFSLVACSILTLNAIFLLFEFYRKFKTYKFFPTCYFMLTLYLFCFLIDWF